MTIYTVLFFLFTAFPLQGGKGKIPPERVPVVDEVKPVSRGVEYRANDVIGIKTRKGFATVLVFPEAEQIAEVTCGDREFWVIDAGKNLVHVKPAKDGARTNMHVVTTTGNLYSFLLIEGPRNETSVDVRVTVELKDPAMRLKVGLDRPAEDLRRKQELQSMAEEVKAAKGEAETARSAAEDVRKALAEFPRRLLFDYKFTFQRSPFYVSGIFHDDKFTYIKAKPVYPVAIYETIDGKPSLVQVEFRDDTYVVRKILNGGYLKSGKKLMRFSRQTEN